MKRNTDIRLHSCCADYLESLELMSWVSSISRVLITVVVFVIFTNLSSQVAGAAEEKKTVLILNSYHKGLVWTDDQAQGIVTGLKKTPMNVTYSMEYMDWKNYPTDENTAYLISYFKFKYQNRKIDLIATTDDAALEFAVKNRKQLFSNAPIVFTGVNDQGIKKILAGVSNVTGIMEKVDPKGTMEIVMKMRPATKNVYVLFDNSESGMSTGNIVINEIHQKYPQIIAITENDKSINELIQCVGKATPDSVIILAPYYSDKNNNAIGFSDFGPLIAKYSTVPVFDLYDFAFGKGVVGGSMISGTQQGEAAGKIATKILQGKGKVEPRDISVATGQFRFDATQLKRFNISLDNVPEGSEIINKPFSFYDTYKQLTITVLIIFFILLLLLMILLFALKRTRHMKWILSENNQALSKVCRELKESESIQKQQVQELIQIQKNLDEREREYSQLFEKMLNGFIEYEILYDQNGKPDDLKVTHANRGIQNQVPLKVEEIIGRTWKEVFGFENKNVMEFDKIVKTGITKQVETYYPQLDVWFLGNLFKVDDIHVAAVFDNITAYKKAIEEVQALNIDLERRVVERTEELQNAINELEAFTYTVSHDLKAPIRAVDSYSKIILEDFGDKLEEDHIEIVNNIREICKTMIDMISKLLKYSATSKMEMQKIELDSRDLFVKIFEEQVLLCQHRRIDLIIETELPTIFADEFLLKQAVQNLISNAIKFTKNRDVASIRIGCELNNQECQFYIRDNGDGFDMEYSGKLFGLFQRLHSNDEFEGSGIGLVTVRNIIKRHGGRIWITGQIDEGAIVYFTLPVHNQGVM